MSLGHWVEVCRHGLIQRQCECFGEKEIRMVPCLPLSAPGAWFYCWFGNLMLPDEATIIMEDGVFHEDYR